MLERTETQVQIWKNQEESIRRLANWVKENFPGAHVDCESYLTETIPRIIRAQARLLRKAGIGGVESLPNEVPMAVCE